MTIKAAIFDMDGLLLDSERVCMNLFLESCKEIGYAINPDVYISCIGSTEARTKSILIEGHGEDFPYDEINVHWRKLYWEEVLDNPVPVKPGAETLLQDIVNSGTPIALATSTAFEYAKVKLRNAKLADYFDFIIAGDQVSNGKPDPEIYIKAAEGLNVETSNCIAFEDSENGVRAALGAGINVVQIPDLVIPSEELISMGHTILSSLVEFNWGSAKDNISNKQEPLAPELTKVQS